jgi:putative peptidoglycan lipid II flippase
MADKWILSYFATADVGGFTLLMTAKTLFNAPLVIVGAAAGAASLPFFSSLFAKGQLYDFNAAVNRSVSRLLAVACLLTAWMTALAEPIVDLFRGGRFSPADAHATARYFAIFALSLALWSAQGIYARAFYAARNTLAPAISGTVVTLVSIPIYALLFHRLGVDGLAIASNIGILAHTVALAILLHKFRLVSIACLDYAELARAAVAAICAYFAITFFQGLQRFGTSGGYLPDLAVIALSSLLWAAIAFAVLRLTGSRLPRQLTRR